MADGTVVSCPLTLTGGENAMVDFETWTEVHARARRGAGKRKIARELGLDRKTVHRILAQARPHPYPRRAPRPSLVAPYLQRRSSIGSSTTASP